MKPSRLTLAVGLLLAVIFGLLLFSFQVRLTEVAVVTTFGKPTRDIPDPGFYLKWPWPIQKVYRFDKRLHDLESKFEQALTTDGYNLLIRVYAGWHITDPKVFFPRFGASVERAAESLEGVLRNAYIGVVGKHPFSHFISTDEKQLKFVEIEQEMLKKVQDDVQASGYGIAVDFLGIKQLGLPESVTKVVFERMQSERKLQEDKIKFEGESEAQNIRSAADLASSRALSEAEAAALRIMAEGELEVAKSFEVFKQEPELASFLFKLKALEQFLKDRSTLILDQNAPPLDLLKSLPGATAPNAPAAKP
jgi:membrane protease subunit HflC